MPSDARDVAVVGASVAGLFTAAKVAGEGLDVGILERAPTLPPAHRTLIATHRVRKHLGSLGDASIVNEIQNFELFADGVVASVGLTRPDVIIERSALVRDLADHAQQSGAKIRLGTSFLGAEPSPSGMTVHVRNEATKRAETLTTSTLVGADGALSRVARHAGWRPQTTVPLVQAQVRCPRGLPSDTVRVWFRPQETPYFYWLIPEGDGRGVVGLIGEERHAVRSQLEAFMRAHSLVPLGYQAARIPLYERWTPAWKRMRSGAVYLVGDAAGHVKPSTVGGLVTGFRGADAVADAILGRGRSALRSLRIELDLHILLRRILQRFGEDDYRRLLKLLEPAEHRLLASYSRDDTGRLLWRLGLRQPRLALVALRVLISGRSHEEVSVGRTSTQPAAQSSALT
ncbi:MAG: FAD-dependent monooxygenase [Actinomycetota bacterium]